MGERSDQISVCRLDLWEREQVVDAQPHQSLGADPATASPDHAPAQLQGGCGGRARTTRMNSLARFAAGASERSFQTWKHGGAMGDRGLWGSSAPARLRDVSDPEPRRPQSSRRRGF